MGFSLQPSDSREQRPSAGLRALVSAADLEAAIRESGEHPVLLLVHSRDCGLSHLALAHLREHMRRRHGSVSYVITVQTHRDLAAALARAFGLRHETPQAILLHAGKVVWHRTHHHITAEALDAALEIVLNTADTPSGSTARA